MDREGLIIGLDVGTTKICTLMANTSSKGQLKIIGQGLAPSSGLKKGLVVHIEQTIRSIQSSLEKARNNTKIELSKVHLGIAGSHIYSFNSTGVVAIRGRVVEHHDIVRAIEASRAIVLPNDRKILHVIPQEFRVDNVREIKDPLGMSGTRLEVHVHIVTGLINHIQNLVRCVEQNNLSVGSIVLQPLASSDAVLSKEEKDLGVCLIDIGGGTSDIAVWKDGALLFSQVIPIGGHHFTRDLAHALQTPLPEAERLKKEFGGVGATSEKTISVPGLPGMKSKEISLSFMSNILCSRAKELLRVVYRSLEERSFEKSVVGGIILTGGGSLLKGLPELTESVCQRPAKVGYPHIIEGVSKEFLGPEYSTALGLLIHARKDSPYTSGLEKSFQHQKIIARLKKSLRNAFRDVF